MFNLPKRNYNYIKCYIVHGVRADGTFFVKNIRHTHSVIDGPFKNAENNQLGLHQVENKNQHTKHTHIHSRAKGRKNCKTIARKPVENPQKAM